MINAGYDCRKKLIELANAGYVFCRNVAPFITRMNRQNSILLFK